MKKTTLLGVMAMLCACYTGVAQPKAIQALSIGNTVPAGFYKSIGIAPATPIIIEFFATYCNTCIKSIPKLNELQKAFEGRLHIVLVSEESTEKVSALFAKPTLQSTNLKVIPADTVLKQYFPHTSVPHVVWIDGKGRVAAITNSDQVTRTHINKLVSGESLHLPTKNDASHYTPEMSLKEQISTDATVYFQSTVTGFVANAKSNVYGTWDMGNGFEKKYFINMGLINILQIALNRISANRFILQTMDSAKLVQSRLNNINAQPALYSYELTLPKIYNPQNYLRQLLQDLGVATGLHISIQHVAVDCYILKRISNTTPVKSSGGKPVFLLPSVNKPQLVMINQPLSKLVRALNAGGLQIPVVVDETGFASPIDLSVKTKDIHDLEAIGKELQGCGLYLEKTKRQLDMVIIKDADNAHYTLKN